MKLATGNRPCFVITRSASAGKRDPDELAALGVEYLHKIVDGSDARFTGC